LIRLLEDNVFIVCRGIDGVTPLHVAVAWNRLATVQLLLSYGADPWIKDDSKKDAFDYAQEQQAWDTYRALDAFKNTKQDNYKIKLSSYRRSHDYTFWSITSCIITVPALIR